MRVLHSYMRTSGSHLDVARLHVQSTRGWQLSELGVPFCHDETAEGMGTNKTCTRQRRITSVEHMKTHWMAS